MDSNDTRALINQLRELQADFYATFGVTDIITNSKIFEILIADSLGHILIPGHSGSRDAKDGSGNEFEYKHFKESSSNHTWTFNDFSDTTIEKLKRVKSVIFAHIDDTKKNFPIFDWYYEVPGEIVSSYLKEATKRITNNRKMINVGPRCITEVMGVARKDSNSSYSGNYAKWIKKIIQIAKQIEKKVGTEGILTSNKFWEVLVALHLDHKVQSEQAKHDAIDLSGNMYEYKVAKGRSWSFQDISDQVLEKYLGDKNIILATVDKDKFIVKKIYKADTNDIVSLLRKKLQEKKAKYLKIGKEIRRKQIGLSVKDILKLKTKEVYSE